MGKTNRKVSLIETLGASLLPEHEFRSILVSHFAGAEQRDRKVVSYLRDNRVAIEARYKDGDLIEIKPGPSLATRDIDEIAARVRTEASETRECVQRCFVFSLQRAEGFWRFADRFQLMPAPDDAPDVPLVLGLHPLVLEYKIRMSADSTFLTLRSQDAETKLVLLLNAFMRFGLTRTGFRQNPRWVIEAFRPEASSATPLRRDRSGNRGTGATRWCSRQMHRMRKQPRPSGRSDCAVPELSVKRRHRQEDQDGLYEIRSQIVHGSRVLLDDLESVFAGGMHPESAEFWLSYDDGESAARVAMRVWLMDKVTEKVKSVSSVAGPASGRAS